MSRIHKALQMLRESKDVSPGVERTPSLPSGMKLKVREKPIIPVNDDSSSTSDRQSASRTIRTQALELEDRTTIDVQLLIDHGLRPSEEDKEVIAQEFRRIKRPVLKIAFDEDQAAGANPNVIMVASALPKSGKTFCSINLSTSIARERDFGAVLVDADVLKPNISRVLGLEEHVGLIDYLLDPTVSIDDILVGSDLHDIILVPAGKPHDESTELLASRRMEEFVAALSQRYQNRAIVVDTPPLLLTNEANVLAHHMGQVILVIEAGVSTQEAVLQALEMLDRDLPINAILNKSRGRSILEYGSGSYGYGYGFYTPGKKSE